MVGLCESPHAVQDVDLNFAQHTARCEREVACDGGGGGRKVRFAHQCAVSSDQSRRGFPASDIKKNSKSKI